MRKQTCLFYNGILYTIEFSGTHTFEWQISIVSGNSITIIKFANRVKATQEFNKYRRKR